MLFISNYTTYLLPPKNQLLGVVYLSLCVTSVAPGSVRLAGWLDLLACYAICKYLSNIVKIPELIVTRHIVRFHKSTTQECYACYIKSSHYPITLRLLLMRNRRAHSIWCFIRSLSNESNPNTILRRLDHPDDENRFWISRNMLIRKRKRNEREKGQWEFVVCVCVCLSVYWFWTINHNHIATWIDIATWMERNKMEMAWAHLEQVC